MSLVQLCIWHGCTVSLIVSGTGSLPAVRVPTQPRPGCVSRPPSSVASTDRLASSSRDWEGHRTRKNEVSNSHAWRTCSTSPALSRESFLCRRSYTSPVICEIGHAKAIPRNENGGTNVRGRERENVSTFINRHLSRAVFAHPPNIDSHFGHLIRGFDIFGGIAERFSCWKMRLFYRPQRDTLECVVLFLLLCCVYTPYYISISKCYL